MKPMTIPENMDRVKIALFDLSIPDLEERREKRLIAESKMLAARVLKLACITRLETIIRNRERVTMNGKTYAVRYEHTKFDQPCPYNSPKTETQPSAAV